GRISPAGQVSLGFDHDHHDGSGARMDGGLVRRRRLGHARRDAVLREHLWASAAAPRPDRGVDCRFLVPEGRLLWFGRARDFVAFGGRGRSWPGALPGRALAAGRLPGAGLWRTGAGSAAKAAVPELGRWQRRSEGARGGTGAALLWPDAARPRP